MKTEVLLAFVFGAAFLFLSLMFAVVAFYLPKPANPEIVGNFLYVMQVILAISAAGVAAVIPGFLHVNLQKKLGRGGALGIRAGGAIAVFVVIFLINPRSIALEAMTQRVSYNEKLSRCTSYIPLVGSPLPGALESCQEARDANPERWEAYRQIARIYISAGDYENSIRNYQEAIARLVGKSINLILKASDVPREAQTEFSIMSEAIAMNLVGLANKAGTSPQQRVALFEESLKQTRQSLWFRHEADASVANQYNALIYLVALNYSYIWLAKGNPPSSQSFAESVEAFENFLKRPNIVQQWAEYHLACLFSEAALRSPEHRLEHEAKARMFVTKSLNSLMKSQSEHVAIHIRMMRCRLMRPETCAKPRLSEPMICADLANLAKKHSEIVVLISEL